MSDGSNTLNWNQEPLAERLSCLWSEYEYRHDLVWRILIRLGFIVAFLSVLPYADSLINVAFRDKLKGFLWFSPCLATVVAIFGCSVTKNELVLLAKIRFVYRQIQNEVLRLDTSVTFQPNKLYGEWYKGSFGLFVIVYMFSLILLSLANLIFFIQF